jgi:hypothetical protein
MAHFAELDDNNIVLRVYVVHDEDTKNSEGQESEEVGQQFLTNIFGGRWLQTSYNSTFRNKFAGITDIYDEIKDVFISASPYPSWILNEETFCWEPPIPEIEDGIKRKWNEETTSWIEVEV